MNYRHHFHAGNFADVLKHAVLARVIDYQAQKPAPLAVIDSHAGAGLYDLEGGQARRTAEADAGIGRLDRAPLDDAAEAVLAPYRQAVAACRARFGPRFYPGSPLVAQALMRPHDRWLGAELEPATAAELDAAIGDDPRFRTERRDGWSLMKAALPPRERRGLVLVDPPFERRDEFETFVKAARRCFTAWPTGTYLFWYPVKNPKQADDFARAVIAEGPARWLRLELHVDRLDLPQGLPGCGLVLINPPWVLHREAEALLPALAARLAQGERVGYRCEGRDG